MRIVRIWLLVLIAVLLPIQGAVAATLLCPNESTPMHHHVEQQIAVVLSGELTFTVGDETKVMRAGDCVVIPPNVRHGGASGPEGCQVLDVFSPPRAAIVSLMAQ